MRRSIHADDEVVPLLHMFGDHENHGVYVTLKATPEDAEVGVGAFVLVVPDGGDAVDGVGVMGRLDVVAWCGAG